MSSPNWVYFVPLLKLKQDVYVTPVYVTPVYVTPIISDLWFYLLNIIISLKAIVFGLHIFYAKYFE